jgi:hypothetical protein
MTGAGTSCSVSRIFLPNFGEAAFAYGNAAGAYHSENG